ncbi:MAG TPA: nuclear transport factor 2 family protein [Candidatus Binataceae bacterium]
MAFDAKTEADLRVMLDKQQIHEVMMRYCRAVDRMDEDLLRSVYHPDATDDHGLFNGKASDFVPWCMKQLREAYTATQHVVANELIEVRGDQAYCEFYFVAHHRYERKGEPRHMTAGGRYVDRFERRFGEWRIAERTVVVDWQRVDRVHEPDASMLTLGKRSREDLAYSREKKK